MRFSNKNENWNEDILGNLGHIRRGASPRPIEDKKWFDKTGAFGWLRISDVSEQNGRIFNIEQKLSTLGQKHTLILEEPHLILSIAATVGKPVINYVPTGVHDGFLVFLNLKTNLEFMFQWLEGFRLNWYKLGQPGSQLNLNSELVKNQSIYIPSFNEQIQIGNFFQNLDQAITLQQTKLEKTQNLKKAMLEKMFPKARSKQPEIRLKGFSGDWVEHKLLNIVEPISSYSLSREVETINITGYRYIHYGDIHRGKVGIVHSEFDLPNIKPGKFEALKRGDLVVADASEDYKGIAMPCVIDYEINNMVVAGLHTIAVRPIKANSIFLYYLIHTNLFKNYGRLIGTGTKVFGITLKNFLNFSCYYPCIEEQTAIGNFFKTLDETLVLQQQQLNTLKNLKHAFLDKMFV